MNLKGFKKVSEDQHKAVLQNEKGHSFTIAKKALSKDHLRRLGELPLHSYKGNDVVEDPTEGLTEEENASDYQTGLPVEKYNPPEEEAEPASFSSRVGKDVDAAANFLSNPMQRVFGDPNRSVFGFGNSNVNPNPETLAPEEEPTDAPAMQEAPGPTQEMPQARTPMASQPSPELAPTSPDQVIHQARQKEVANNAKDFAMDAAFVDQDLRNGHITPKTYADLFNERDTLGKIGTLFGLLLSGVGSGLSHQPNAVMEMMNKEIERDLDAQQKSKTNAQNLYKINLDRELNKANISLAQAQAQGVLAEMKLKAQTYTMNQMIIMGLGSMRDTVNKIPPGQQRDQAMGTFQGVEQAGAQKIRENVLGTAQAIADSPESQFRRKNQAMRMAGMISPAFAKEAEFQRGAHVPGIGDASVEVPDHVRQELVSHKKLQDAAEDLLDYTKTHTTLIPGTPAYNVGEEKAETLRQMIREGMLGTVFRESEKPLLEKFVPNNPGGFLKVFQAQPKIKAILESNIMQGNALKQAYGLPVEKSRATEKESTSNHKSKSGKPIEFKGGKWVYKKANK